MAEGSRVPQHRDRARQLAVIGEFLILLGVLTVFFAPLPMYWVYDGQPGRGGLSFACLVCQIIASYVIAAILILVGYGTRKVRRWARTFSLTLLELGVVVGLAFIPPIFGLFCNPLGVILGVLFGLLAVPCALLVPWALINFYENRDIALTFETKDPNTYWTEKVPMPILVLTFLFVFYMLILPLPMMLNGVFPFFGVLLSGYRGIFAHNVLILCFIVLAWGTFRQRSWAWWGAVICFAALLISSIVTFPRLGYAEILNSMAMTAYEAEEFQRKIPLQGTDLAVLAGVPFIVTLRRIILSREHFGGARDVGST